MTMNTVTSIAGTETSLPRVARGTYNRNLLRRAMPLLIAQKFGQQRPLGQRKGQSMVFRRYEKLSQTTVPLTEGVTPTGVAISKTDYVATLAQYGNYAMITDMVDLTSVDPTITEVSGLMGENMAESVDTIHYNNISTGTNWVRCIAAGVSQAGAITDVDDTITKAAIDLGIRELKGEDAKTFTPMVPGSQRINTYPIARAFWLIIHTDQEHDLYAADAGFYDATANNFFGFTPIEQYSGHAGVIEGEVGKYRNVRFVGTTNLKIGAGAGAAVASTGLKHTSDVIDVYFCLLIARDAYGIVPLSGQSARIIVKSAKSGGTGDPLEQRNTVGWKAITTSVILNDAWILRIECGTLA